MVNTIRYKLLKLNNTHNRNVENPEVHINSYHENPLCLKIDALRKELSTKIGDIYNLKYYTSVLEDLTKILEINILNIVKVSTR